MIELTIWQQIGNYEHEVSMSTSKYTGWYRCVGGRLADGRWPEWHTDGRQRYSKQGTAP